MADDSMALLETLRKASGGGDIDVPREGVRILAQAIMEAEVSKRTGLPKGERDPERRLTHRNGYRERRWDTRVGTIDLAVPRVRDGSYLPSLLEPRRRAERALLAVVQEAYVAGVSTRRVIDLVRALGIEGINRSEVSRMCASLDAEVEAFRRRPLTDAAFPYLWLDATYLKVREAGRVVSMAALIATGVAMSGERPVLGLELAAHGEAGHRGQREGATDYPDAVDVAVDSGGSPVAPADSLARLRKALIDRAERREAPVTRLCREAGISRSRFYELRARYRQYGEAGLRPKPRPPERPERQLPEPLVDAIVAYAVEHPTHGQRTIALVLATPRYGGWRVSHGGVANVLRRAGLGRRLARLAAAESLAASEGGPLTERMLRRVRAIERARPVHIGSDAPGDELFLDTFYVGHLKGVGKVWQLSAVDGASSFGIARVIAGDKTSAVMARFLVDDVLPACQRAGLRLLTATTDNGPEFGRTFADACRAAGVRHHRIPPRSPNLNAFVERFQGTVLHLHYRVAFRYRYYTRAETIDADLQAFLRFYNFERPHRGYRTRGRVPASIFFSQRHEVLHEMGACDDDRHAA